MTKLLKQRSRASELSPSRLAPSAIGARREQLTRNVAIPVDKDSSAPLATIVMPEDISVTLPMFAPVVQESVEGLLQEWAHAEEILAAGLSPSLSLLVYGAPGTGKTTLALWLAKELNRPVILARLDGLISSFLGTTARNLGTLFGFANRFECVLVLDEFDAIAKVRDDPNEVGEIKRVVNALLQNMDARDGVGVTIGLTNHEGLLDPAIWRRFEVQLAVPLPAQQQRVLIAERALGESGDSHAEAKMLAWLAEGLSGAEIQTLATKYRKRRLFPSESERPPIRTIAQIARSTSNHISRTAVGLLDLDEAAQVRSLAENSFTHPDLAYLFGLSTKTIQRRLGEQGTEE